MQSLGFFNFALVLWPSLALTSLLALGHFHLVTWDISLARLFSRLERGKMNLGGRELLRDRWGGSGIRPRT